MRNPILAALAAVAVSATAAAQTTPPPASGGEVIEIAQPPARSWLGMGMEQGMRIEAGLQYIDPPVVTTIAPGSPAEAAGLRVGDTLLTIDGCDLQTVCVNWRTLVPGQRYRLRVRSGDTERETTLVPAPPRAPAPSR